MSTCDVAPVDYWHTADPYLIIGFGVMFLAIVLFLTMKDRRGDHR